MRYKLPALVLLLASCSPKTFIYEGEHVKMRVAQTPCGEFVVDDLVVVAFDLGDKAVGSYDIYQFAVLMGKVQIRDIYLSWLEYEEEQGEYLLYEYIEVYDRLLIYKTYNIRPDYREIRAWIPFILRGQVEPEKDIKNFSQEPMKYIFMH